MVAALTPRAAQRGAALLLPVLACACAGPKGASPVSGGGIVLNPQSMDAQVPDYAKFPYEAFSRETAVAIALREWRAWGMLVNDAPPGPDLPLGVREDRQAGMWQRVGDYWWIGQPTGSQGSGWSGKYGEGGREYRTAPPAWSAAFISYLMRVSGAGDRFPYSALHATYINAAASGNPILAAQPPETYAPLPGDLICFGRRGAQGLRFTDLPASSFFGHCDLVVGTNAGQLAVVGGNVSAGVTMKHVPVTSAGTLATPEGSVLDTRYPWFVVLRVAYDR